MTMPTEEDEAITKIQAGEPLSYGYDVYGTGRVWFKIRWDPKAQQFLEWRKDEDLEGHVSEGEGPIEEKIARRHVRASWHD